MSREEEAKLSSVLASWAPAVKEPFDFDKDDNDDDNGAGNEEAKDDYKIICVASHDAIIVDDGGRRG